MASRFDQPTQEPDFDRYDAKPLDAADEPPDDPPTERVCKHCGYSIKRHTGTFLVCPFRESQQFEDAEPQPAVDPAEYAAIAAMNALQDLRCLVMDTHDLERAHTLRKLVQAIWISSDALSGESAGTIDRILERRR